MHRTWIVPMVLFGWVMWMGEFVGNDVLWKSLAPAGIFQESDFPTLGAEKACTLLARVFNQKTEAGELHGIFVCLPEDAAMEKSAPSDTDLACSPGTPL